MVLSGRVAIVSGGTSGIGRATAFLLAERGCLVTAFGVDERQTAETRTLATERGLDVWIQTADIVSEKSVGQIVDSTLRRNGPVDILVNNAAIRPVGTILDTSVDAWDKTFDVNIRGMFLLTKHVLPHMIARESGVIVNIASGAARGRPNLLAYSSSKGAIFGFTRSLALDHAKNHIRVNAVVPGITRTAASAALPPSVEEKAKKLSVAARMNEPEDVASAIVWLASEEAATISGATLDVGNLPPYAH